MGDQSQLDGRIQAGRHHRPHDVVDRFLVEFAVSLGGVVSPRHDGVELGDLLGGQVGNGHKGTLRLVGRRGSMPTLASGSQRGQGTPTSTSGVLSPEGLVREVERLPH